MIELTNVKRSYPGFTLDIDRFSIEEGTITGVVGLNGSGKTTLFRLITGLAAPDEGSVMTFGHQADTLPVSLKKEIGAVFVDSGFPKWMTPADVQSVLKAFYDSFDPAQYNQLLEQEKLPKDKMLSMYSSGMLAKFRIIAALSHSPRFLLLDEPTSGLDVAARREILELLQNYMMTPGRSILISSHIASDLETLCDDFWMIQNGKMVLHESVDALTGEYGILHVSDSQLEQLDLAAVRAKTKTPGGWDLLVIDRKFYQENYPALPIEKGNIDDLLLIVEGDH